MQSYCRLELFIQVKKLLHKLSISYFVATSTTFIQCRFAPATCVARSFTFPSLLAISFHFSLHSWHWLLTWHRGVKTLLVFNLLAIIKRISIKHFILCCAKFNDFECERSSKKMEENQQMKSKFNVCRDNQRLS